MASGDLTRHFGTELVELLAERFVTSWRDFDCRQFCTVARELEPLSLMQRVEAIGLALGQVLPPDPAAAWQITERILPAPLGERGQPFNDGYWMLPVAAYWSLAHCPPADASGKPRHPGDAEALNTVLRALEELTQRGTSEFAIRRCAQAHPAAVAEQVHDWTHHASFHVRRLASEGTRPYLPWGGKLRVSRDQQYAYLEAITPLARDVSRYVRRSIGNHVRDWRRIDSDVADRWIADHDPPADVRKLAEPKKHRRSS